MANGQLRLSGGDTCHRLGTNLHHRGAEHVRPVAVSGIEQLVQVLRRDGTDRSAHEVLRDKLARSEDRELRRGLQVALRERLEARVGPSRRDDIAALEHRDDLPAAEATLETAQKRRAAAEERRLAVEASLAAAPVLRAHLPGVLGARARAERRVGESARTASPWHARASSGRFVGSRPACSASLLPSSSAPSSRRSDTSSGPATPTSTRIPTRWTSDARFGGC